MIEGRAKEILRILRKTFASPKLPASDREPFKTLVVTIISQNTAAGNTTRAFDNLSKRFKIEPEVLANAETSQIEECLKVGGLYRNKAKAIKQVSKTILEDFQGDLKQILLLPFEDARKTLMQLPGVGPKTADVVLLFSAHKQTIPVDTHVNRVSKRLGLVPAKGDYEAVRSALQFLFAPNDYLAVHILLISHGRKYCKARKPLCTHCPISSLCPSKQL